MLRFLTMKLSLQIISDGNHIPLPLNEDILIWAKETQDILSQAKLPKSVKFYNIYGIDYDTAHTVWYFTIFSTSGFNSSFSSFHVPIRFSIGSTKVWLANGLAGIYKFLKK